MSVKASHIQVLALLAAKQLGMSRYRPPCNLSKFSDGEWAESAVGMSHFAIVSVSVSCEDALLAHFDPEVAYYPLCCGFLRQ